MVTGELVGALAMTEPAAGSDVQAIRTRATRDGNVYRLTGSKIFITNGQHANLVLVAAKTDPTRARQGHQPARRRDRRRRRLHAAAASSTRSA